MWQGRDSTADEKGSSALLAKDLDDSLNGSPVQVSVHIQLSSYAKASITLC
jgi:hypothetical protein